MSSDFCGAQPPPIQPTRPRCRAGKVGADGASPSKGFRWALPRRVRWDTGGTTSVSSDSRGAQPRPQFRRQETSAHRLPAQFQQAAEGVFDKAIRATGAGGDADGQVFTIRQPVCRNDFFFRVQFEMPDFTS